MTTTLQISGDALAPGSYAVTPANAPPAPTPAPVPAVRPRKWIGLGLTGMGSTNREYPFADWVKFARKFGTAAKTYDASAPVDADGKPTDDFGIFWDQCRDVNGDYKVFAQGNVTFKAFSASVSKAIYDATTDTTTATLTFNQPAGKVFAPSLAVYTNHKGCKSIQVLGKADLIDSTFSADFINSLDGIFDCLRFMDWAETNFSQQAKWSDRPKLTDAQWSIKGVPWEVCIALCNRLGVDGWFNIPCIADDDYVKQLGVLIKSQLKPGLHAYIEYSNELWNGGTFSNRNGVEGQFVQHQRLTQQEIAAGDTTLSAPDGLKPNPSCAAFRRTAKRSAAIRKILDQFDPTRELFRVVLPIGVNAGWEMLKVMLDWIKANAGKPSDIFHAVAVAPYFNESKALAASATATMDDLLNGFAVNAPLAAESQGMNEATAYATTNNLPTICYEMGIDNLQVDTNLPNKVAAQEHPRIGRTVTTFLFGVYRNVRGGCYFADANSYDKNNMYGLRQHVRETATPKFSAVAAFSAGLRSGGGE